MHRLRSAVGRLYGDVWDEAPAALQWAASAVVVNAVLGLLVTVAAVLLSGEPFPLKVLALLLLAVLVLVQVGVTAFLLVGNRLVWLLLALLHAGGLLSRPPTGLVQALVVVPTAATLVVLLLPGVLREVWRSRPSPYADRPDVRRPD